MTGSGKTWRALFLAHMSLRAGSSVVWNDCAKGGEILYLLEKRPYRKDDERITVLYPGIEKCKVDIQGSPFPIDYVPIIQPRTMFRQIRPGLNIVCVRPFFTELTPYTRYLSEAINGLIDDAYRHRIAVSPLKIFLDEFQQICPSRRAQESSQQHQLGQRIGMAVNTLRSEGIGLAAFSQSHRNVAPSVRPQFSWLVVGRNPDPGRDDFLGNLVYRYEPMISKFKPNMAMTFFPDARFYGPITWPKVAKPEGATVEYSGYILPRRGKKGDDSYGRLKVRTTTGSDAERAGDVHGEGMHQDNGEGPEAMGGPNSG